MTSCMERAGRQDASNPNSTSKELGRKAQAAIMVAIRRQDSAHRRQD